jgi:hypothetical protein
VKLRIIFLAASLGVLLALVAADGSIWPGI